jgi:hypothetical protein
MSRFASCTMLSPNKTAYSYRQGHRCHLCERDAVRPTSIAYPGAASAIQRNRSESWFEAERGCCIRLLQSAQNRKAARLQRSRIRSVRPIATRAWVRRDSVSSSAKCSRVLMWSRC